MRVQGHGPKLPAGFPIAGGRPTGGRLTAAGIAGESGNCIKRINISPDVASVAQHPYRILQHSSRHALYSGAAVTSGGCQHYLQVMERCNNRIIVICISLVYELNVQHPLKLHNCNCPLLLAGARAAAYRLYQPRAVCCSRSDTSEAASLLDLPDRCLLRVLQCCADDCRTLFSAARAHSRLHQAAAMVKGLSIRAVGQQQEQADDVVQYLSAHGQQVGSLEVDSATWEGRVTLCQLPHHILHGLISLKFCSMSLQLQPGGGFQGVLGAGVPLQQLDLECCTLLDGADGLASAMLQLTDLQHLKFVHNMRPPGNHITRGTIRFPSSILQGLQQLTYLELKIFGAPKQWESDATKCRRHLQGLTNLKNLQFTSNAVPVRVVRASMLAGMSQLTCLKADCVMPSFPSKMRTIFQAEALEGKTQLQHLEITNYQRVVTGLIRFMQDGTAELLSHLGTLQQLTYLSLSGTMGGTSPCWLVDAYSALTASTNLHHLNISGIDLQGGAWQYILQAGRQLPHLTALHFSDRVKASPSGDAYPIGPEGSTLVSCCPALRCLSMSGWQFSAALLASLTGLSSLQELRLQAEAGSKGLEAVCQLTGLRRLHLGNLKRYDDAEGFPLQLTELQQLTYLEIIDEKDRLGVPRNYPQQAKLAIAGDQMFMLRFICEVSVNDVGVL